MAEAESTFKFATLTYLIKRLLFINSKVTKHLSVTIQGGFRSVLRTVQHFKSVEFLGFQFELRRGNPNSNKKDVLLRLLSYRICMLQNRARIL